MNKRFNNPSFYHHVVYRTQSWTAVAPFIFGMALALGTIFLWNYINPREALSLHLRTLAAVLALIIMIPLFIFRFRQLKKLQIGINSDGFFIRGYGLLTWSEIKKLELMQHAQHGKAIKITTYSPAALSSEPLQHDDLNRSLFSRLGESLDELFIVGGDFISLPVEELFSLLQEYHTTHQQEDGSVSSVPSKNKVVREHIPSTGIPTWLVRFGISVLFILALAVALILKGGMVGLWVGIGVGACVATLIFFQRQDLFFEIILFGVSSFLIVFGISSFIYEFVTRSKLMINAIIGASVGLLIFVLLFILRRRRRSLDKKTLN